MDVMAVMQELKAKLDAIAGLNNYAYPTDKPAAPAGIVGYPETIDFDTTGGRGSDEVLFPVVIVVGRVQDRSTAERLAAYCSGSGPASVKQALETKPHTSMDTVRVSGAEFDVVMFNALDYAAAIFDVHISGSGSS